MAVADMRAGAFISKICVGFSHQMIALEHQQTNERSGEQKRVRSHQTAAPLSARGCTCLCKDAETKSVHFGWERTLPGRGDLSGFLQGRIPAAHGIFPAEMKSFHPGGRPRCVPPCVFTCLASCSAGNQVEKNVVQGTLYRKKLRLQRHFQEKIPKQSSRRLFLYYSGHYWK